MKRQRNFNDVVEAMLKVLPKDDPVALELERVQKKSVWDAPEVLWHKHGYRIEDLMATEWGDPTKLSTERIEALHIWRGSDS